jgi:hypothetical protein
MTFLYLEFSAFNKTENDVKQNPNYSVKHSSLVNEKNLNLIKMCVSHQKNNNLRIRPFLFRDHACCVTIPFSQRDSPL